MIDISGQTFGHWHVFEFSFLDKKKRAYWNCTCDICGRTKAVRGDNLRRGTSTRCVYCSNKWQRSDGK